MTAFAVVLLEALSCIGLGSAGLRVFNVGHALTWDQKIAWSFSLGLGMLGWILFFFGIAGLFSTIPLLILLCVGVSGIYFLRIDVEFSRPSVRVTTFVLAAVFAAVFLFDILEALAPPGDADTLTYHFTLPKQFLEAGRLEFIPRAIDGAVPLLLQMTYIPALGLGGEKALTLWTMVSGWMVGLFIYSLCRGHLNKQWSAAIALILLTTPAVLYGGGSGQVEVRNALFVMLAAAAIAEAFRTGFTRYVLLAGIAAGFFVGAKYLGLIFALACGLTVFMKGRRIRQGVIFSLGVIAAGSQWYLWNWWNTGDPIFPVLISHFGIGDQALWPAAFQAWFKFDFPLAENAVPASLFWFFAYPFQATFAGFPIFESARTGFGPFIILVLPFAILGAWRFHKRIFASPLFPIFVIAALFYTFWFFTGSSQRVRHLLPVYPLIAVVVMVAAIRFAETDKVMKPLAAAIIVTAVIQLGGHGVFASNFIKYHLTNESRDAFLSRNVPDYGAVAKLNALNKGDKVMILSRQIAYYLSVPFYFAQPNHQALIDLSEPTFKAKRFLSQLQEQNISHILITGNLTPSTVPRSLNTLIPSLVQKGCGQVLDTFPLTSFSSRTLNLGKKRVGKGHLFEISNYDCAID